MEKRKIFLLLALISLGGCDNSFERSDIMGLWELKQVTVDALDRPVKPTLLQIKPNSTFSVSMVSGDFSGIYQLRGRRLNFDASDHKWFRTSWTIDYYPDYILLQGTEWGYRGTILRLEKITEVPDYRSFEEKVLGDWQLYKIRTKGEVEAFEETTFTIDESGRYAITQEGATLDEGQAIINTRHHKIVFVRDSIQWDAWFYGRELRLENKQMDIQYSLRKYDDPAVESD